MIQNVTGHSKSKPDSPRQQPESVTLLHGLLESISAVSVQGYAADGTTQYWNQASERLYGYTAQEAIGRNLLELIIPPEMQTGVTSAIQHMLETGEPIPASELLLMRADGSRVAVFSSHAILQMPGRAPEFFCFDIDLTERQHIQRVLHQTEEQFRAVVQTANDAIITIDAQQNVTFWNIAAERMFGFSADEMLGNPLLRIVPQSFRQQKKESIERVFAGGEQRMRGKTFEAIGLGKEGQEIPIEISLAEWKTQDALFATAIIRDIGERKQREHELQAIAILSAALRTATNRAEMLPVIVEQLVSLLGADTASIEIIDSQTGEAVVEAAHGTWEVLVGSRQKKGTGINAIISQTLKPYITQNLENDPNLTYYEWAREKIHGSAGIPLIAQGKLIGFIWIGLKKDIKEADVRLLSSIADIAANAIHRATLHDQTQRDAAELAQAYDTTLEGWARALELRDYETKGHSQRVIEMTLRLVEAFGMDEAEFVHIRRGAILHDIGKMGIPDAILNKPGALNDDEWAIMRKHPQYAYDLLSSIEHLRPALDIPFCHHEKWDGSGYPHGLAGEEIPLAARFFAVVDVWDALRSDRVYRQKWPEEKVLEYIRLQSGTHFDPKVVSLFLEVIKRNGI